mmetsp:Transcript_11070/g.45155  ORF Transcript_11070/g.45155 Transcript_11070/m.45155 type:complete len:516 (-) Transcript_11070:112-1659(-)
MAEDTAEAFAPSLAQQTLAVAFGAAAAVWAGLHLWSGAEAAALRRVLGHWTLVGAVLGLAAAAEFGGVVAHGGKEYSRDEFLFVLALFLLVAAAFTREQSPSMARAREKGGGGPLLMSREQTEEWKGWMQFAFLLYHHYRAAEWYNGIRVLVSAYAFLTGYGNYLYFAQRADYSFRRLLFMLWRLNFLTLLLAVAMAQPYVLYYIVPLHTFYFLLTYATMAALPAWNRSPALLSLKLSLAFAAVWALWDGPLAAHFDQVFAPLAPLLAADGSLHEWHFRTFLDHYSTLFGIAFAVHAPRLARFLARAEALPRGRRIAAKAALACLALAPCLWWARAVLLPLDKFAYNALHPYLVAVPITAYLVLRNLTPGLRGHHLELFRRFGTTTLETYVMQYHLFLADSARGLLLLLPGMRLLNLLLSFSLLCAVAYLLFLATMALRDPMCGHASLAELAERWLWLSAGLLAAAALAALLPLPLALCAAATVSLCCAALALRRRGQAAPPPLGPPASPHESAD